MSRSTKFERFTVEALKKQEPNTARIYMFGPTEAQMILDAQRNFRAIQRETVRKYARDMVAGEWILNGADNIVLELTPKSDAPYVGFNGQHRMNAVVLSGVEVPFPVYVQQEAVDDTVFDRGRPRTIAQVLAHLGYDRANERGAIARLLILQQGAHRSEGTTAIVMASLEQYSDAINFAIENLSAKTRGVTTALRTAVARAYYQKGSRTRLREFCQRFYSLELDRPDDDALYWLIKAINGPKMSAATYYLRCEKAVSRFLERTPLTGLQPTSHAGQLLPIPVFEYVHLTSEEEHETRLKKLDIVPSPRAGSMAEDLLAVLLDHRGKWYTATELVEIVTGVTAKDDAAEFRKNVKNAATCLQRWRKKSEKNFPAFRFERVGPNSYRYTVLPKPATRK